MSYPGLELVTPAAQEPISLGEAKAWLRVEHGEEDGLIAEAVRAARYLLEQQLGQQLVTATWDVFCDSFPGELGVIELPLPPTQSVDSVTYVDTDGNSQTLAASKYQLDSKSRPARLAPAPGETWPSTEAGRLNAVTIRVVAGYGAAAELPGPLRQEVKHLVADLYEDRQRLRQVLRDALSHGAAY